MENVPYQETEVNKNVAFLPEMTFQPGLFQSGATPLEIINNIPRAAKDVFQRTVFALQGGNGNDMPPVLNTEVKGSFTLQPGNRYEVDNTALKSFLAGGKAGENDGGQSGILFGKDKQLNIPVCVSIMQPTFYGRASETQDYFSRIRVLANLQHNHIVKVYDMSAILSDANKMLPVLITEKIEGHTTNELSTKGKEIDPTNVVEIVKQIADALDYIHTRGIVHGDVTPKNIMLRDTAAERDTLSGTPDAVLIDFGTASGYLENDDRPREPAGYTRKYAAPEQINRALGPISAATDQYGLAVSTELMLGIDIHHASSDAEEARFPEDSKYPDYLTPELVSVLKKATNRDLTQRYATCKEFADELKIAVAEMTSHITNTMV